MVGTGNITGKPIIMDTLPTGMTVKAGWPTSQPTGWQCLVTATRNQVACSYTGPLPLAGGASLGAAIQIPVVGQDHVGGIRNEEPPLDADPALFQKLDFFLQSLRIHHDAVSDEAFLSGLKNP